MTIDEVKTRLIEVAKRAIHGDFEAAHAEEDKLLADVLTAIATGNDDGFPRELAKQALRSRELNFKRVMS